MEVSSVYSTVFELVGSFSLLLIDAENRIETVMNNFLCTSNNAAAFPLHDWKAIGREGDVPAIDPSSSVSSCNANGMRANRCNSSKLVQTPGILILSVLFGSCQNMLTTWADLPRRPTLARKDCTRQLLERILPFTPAWNEHC